jgi:predicted RNA binding protein YcfA (HicA-like mRNA interferase family)
VKLPRSVSGNQLVGLLCRDWNYAKVHQVGSHVILETHTPSHQRIAVPNHKTLRVGTLNAILRTVATHKGVSREQVLKSL